MEAWRNRLLTNYCKKRIWKRYRTILEALERLKTQLGEGGWASIEEAGRVGGGTGVREENRG
jgi:hypothetical protein